MQSRESRRVIMWAIEIAILVGALLIVGFLESLDFFKPIFTQPGGFFIRMFVAIGWALACLYFNDSRARSS